jgi:uncharacterized membrane protein
MTVETTAMAADLESPPHRPPPRNRMAVAVLSLVGLFISLYLSAYSAGLIPLICGVGSCETVQASEWAKQAGIPVPVIGVGGYLALLAIALLGLQPGRTEQRGPGLLLFALAAIGVGYSAFLTYLEARVINAWCMWCVTSAVVMTLIFVATLPELFRRGETA